MMDFTFEDSPWELFLDEKQPGESVSAPELLAVLEQMEDDRAEEFLDDLIQKGVKLDIGQLPPIPAPRDTAARLRQEKTLAQSGNLITGLDELDPLRLYLEELAAIPVCGDVQVLAQRLLEGSESAMEQLVNHGLSRVVRRSSEQAGKGVLLLDLIQEASLGLYEGLRCYAGGDVEAHCDLWICQYLAKVLLLQAHVAGVGQKLRQGMEDYRDVDGKLLAELGRNPTLEEIAQAMHITPDQAQTYASMVAAAQSRRQVDARAEPQEPDPEEEQAVEDTAYFQSRQRILEMLSTLSQQEAQLLSLRFGLEGGLPLSPEQVGAKLGLTPQEVVAMEAAALAKLRNE